MASNVRGDRRRETSIATSPAPPPPTSACWPPRRARTDVDPRQPSLLPDWTVGHVLTHIARNADSDDPDARRARPVRGWRRGRRADIEAGAGRPPDELVADVRGRSGGWSSVGRRNRRGTVRRRRRRSAWCRATTLPFRRWREIEIHHADLGFGYTFADMPADFVRLELRRMEMQWKARQPMGLTPLPDAVLQLPEHERLAWLMGRIGSRAGTRRSALTGRTCSEHRSSGAGRRRLWTGVGCVATERLELGDEQVEIGIVGRRSPRSWLWIASRRRWSSVSPSSSSKASRRCHVAAGTEPRPSAVRMPWRRVGRPITVTVKPIADVPSTPRLLNSAGSVRSSAVVTTSEAIGIASRSNTFDGGGDDRTDRRRPRDHRLRASDDEAVLVRGERDPRRARVATPARRRR